MSASLRRLLGVAAIALAAAWIYAPALSGSWLWDDDMEFSANTLLRDPGGWWKAWTGPTGLDYFPLKTELQWMEWHLWGDHPWCYHLVNLALHVIGAVMLWLLLDRIFGGRVASERRPCLAAWLGGLIFAVHPLCVESVAWISEFKNVLSLPFLLLAMIAWVDADEAGRGRAAYARSLLWYLLALLCKTTVVMLPAALLLYAWWRRGRVGPADVRRTLPFFGLSAGLGAATLWFQWHRAMRLSDSQPALPERLHQAGWSALAYLRDAVWPRGLMTIYPPAPANLPSWAPWLSLALLFGILWHLGRRWPSTSGRGSLFGLGFFYLNLLPVLGVVPMSYLRIAPRADHLAYLALVGLAGLAAGLAGRVRVAALPLAAAIVVFAFSSRHYAGAFRSQESLWSEAAAKNPRSWLAQANLGKVMLQHERWADATSRLEAAIRLQPDSAEVYTNLGYVEERLGRPADARAHYEQGERVDPGFAGAHFNLGTLLLNSGNPAGASRELALAVRYDPGGAKAHNNYGLALSRAGRRDEGVEQFRLALHLDPRLVDAQTNLGNAYFRAGRLPEAMACYRAALRIAPDSVPARLNLAAVLRRMATP